MASASEARRAKVGGYRVVKELGRGKIGPIVLARRWGMTRPITLRLLRPEWACLPRYVAKLSRDAFAAAQVTHPNIVRVETFGEDAGQVYFVSEGQDGASLAGQGVLTVPQAVAHVLQAARGLRFAHGQGLTHGDIRPENLVVDDQGRTRLDGLGLSRTPDVFEAEEARETRGPIAVGPEEQALAASAPFRADVKGLGLALVRLLTGNTEAHPTALIAAGLPMNLVEIVRGMVEPKPRGNLADLDQVVPTLERFLNSRGGTSGTTPREEDTAVLAECARAFEASPSARLRTRIGNGASIACAAVVALGLLAGNVRFAASVLGLGLLTALADFVVTGQTHQRALYGKWKGFAVESKRGDWLVVLAGVGVVAAALYALNLHRAWLGFVVVAACASAVLHLAVDGKIAAERRGAVEEARALLKRLRLQGVGEESLWRFARSAAGTRWEGLFEELFGFEALLRVRTPAERGLIADLKRGAVPGREALARWIDGLREARRRERDWVLIQAIEERGMEAEGINLLTARRKARRVADALLAVAAEIRKASREADRPASKVDGNVRPTLAWAVKQAVEAPEKVLAGVDEGEVEGRDWSWVVDLIVGPRTRFLAGSVLLAGFLLWVHQNELISGEQVTDVANRAIQAEDPLKAIREAKIDVKFDKATKPLTPGVVPRSLASWFHGFAPGVAGLILVVSAFWGGSRAGIGSIAGAILAMIGPALGLPGAVAMGAGAALAVIGVVLGRNQAA